MFARHVALLLRRPAHAYLSRPALPCPQDLCIRTVAGQPRRLYATPAKPKKGSIGETTRTVKRAVKKTAAKPASSSASASTSPVKKATGTRAKAASEKPRPKPKPKPKPKRQAKAARKTPVKKVLTDAQQASRQLRLDRAQIKELKKAALDAPKVARTSAWMEFCKSKKGMLSGRGSSAAEIRQRLGQHQKEMAAAWKECSPAELEHYNHQAHTVLDASRAAYKSWVESHTPEEIHAANKARKQLRPKLSRGKGSASAYPLIEDARQAKRPIASYLQFSVDRNKSGDFKHISLGERSKLIGQEWKALSESERKKYVDLGSEARTRYADEHSSVYGYAPPSFNGNGGQQVASAAA